MCPHLGRRGNSAVDFERGIVRARCVRCWQWLRAEAATQAVAHRRAPQPRLPERHLPETRRRQNRWCWWCWRTRTMPTWWAAPTAPYLNSLITQGTLATSYYANSHPSMGNYFMLTTGNIVSNDDAYSGTVPPPEIVSALTAAGKSWKVYAEGIPAVGYTGDEHGCVSEATQSVRVLYRCGRDGGGRQYRSASAVGDGCRRDAGELCDDRGRYL